MRHAALLWLVALCASASVRGEPAENPWFTDITEAAGLDFVHATGASGGMRMPEIMCGGAALFDYDSDGDLDIYLTHADGPNRLYRQESPGRFVDATTASKLGDRGFGMGVAVGDIDNDGDLDVYVTNQGPDRLYRNGGDGTFEDVSGKAGIRVDGWTSSAVFVDYDRDGFLDLYVARYIQYDPARRCTDPSGRVDYCSPGVFRPTHDVLLRNDRDGSFTDVSERAGILAAAGAGLGVVAADLDGNGWQDLVVANDGDANRYWVNQKNGTFRDQALLAGLAYSLDGQAEAGMGIVAADLDDDLDLDLLLTHLANETNTFYANQGGSRGFTDATAAAGLARDSLTLTGFGVAAFDIELDGDLDLVIANGRVTRGAAHPGTRLDSPWSYFAEPNLVYRNRGGAKFERVHGVADAFTAPVEISRGLAVGDIDGDGDLDVLLSNAESRARLYRNDAPRSGNWLIVRAVDPRLGREAIGARVTVIAGDLRRVRAIGGGSGYLSQSDSGAHFGLGARDTLDRVEVRWPDGLRESFGGGPVNRAIVLERGSGKTLP